MREEIPKESMKKQSTLCRVRRSDTKAITACPAAIRQITGEDNCRFNLARERAWQRPRKQTSHTCAHHRNRRKIRIRKRESSYKCYWPHRHLDSLQREVIWAWFHGSLSRLCSTQGQERWEAISALRFVMSCDTKWAPKHECKDIGVPPWVEPVQRQHDQGLRQREDTQNSHYLEDRGVTGSNARGLMTTLAPEGKEGNRSVVDTL